MYKPEQIWFKQKCHFLLTSSSWLSQAPPLAVFQGPYGWELFCSQLQLASGRPGKPGSVDLIHGNEAGWGVDSSSPLLPCHRLGHRCPTTSAIKGGWACTVAADSGRRCESVLSPRVPFRSFQCMHTSSTAPELELMLMFTTLGTVVLDFPALYWDLVSLHPPSVCLCFCLSVYPRCKRLKFYFYPVSVFLSVTFLVYLLISGSSL